MIKKLIDIIMLKHLLVEGYKKGQIYTMIFLSIILIFLRSSFHDSFYTIVIDLFLMYFTLYVLIYILKVIIASTYRKRNKISKENYNNTTIGINNILNLFFIFFFFSGILIRFQVDIIKFLTISGLFFAGLAWVFKEHIINIVNGLILMFSNNIRIGDYIYINNFRGKVKNITLLNTEIMTDEGDITIIPNETILRSEIINFSKTNSKKILFNFDVSLNKLNLKKIEDFLRKEEKKDKIIDNIELKIGKIKSKSVNIIVVISLVRYNFELDSNIRNKIKERIIAYLLS